MEVKIEKTQNAKNKTKFNFGNLKIRNKIIFGFFIVSVISGLANYYSNLFIVNQFRTVNDTMYTFHDIFALQKKLEIMVESYLDLEYDENVSEKDFIKIRLQIEDEFRNFIHAANASLNNDLISRFISENELFYEKQYEAVAIHRKKMEASKEVSDLEAFEKEKRYKIREFINAAGNENIYFAFSRAEYASKEMLYQYKDEDRAKEWAKALDKARNVFIAENVVVPEFDEYYDITKRTSEAVMKVEMLDAQEQRKLDEFRYSIENLNLVQDEVSKTITNQNLNQINNIIVLGMFVFIFILIFITVFCGYAVSIFISRPIKELSEFALAVGKGNFQRRININTKDEIGQTAKAFNIMLDRIEESTQVLEIKVNARTKRLEELSRNLEEQVDNKTKELNEKISELEKFNDLAVGRELRMVELKREIEILKQGGMVGYAVKSGRKDSKGKIGKMNCWDFWECDKVIKEKCPAYLTDTGRECWKTSHGICPRSKERGFTDCRNCTWYKKLNNTDK